MLAVVDEFGLTDRAGLMAGLASVGPAGVVRRVREAERAKDVAQDDATIASCSDLAP